MAHFNRETDLIIVSSHFNEDLMWLEKSPFPVIVSTNHPHYVHPPSTTVFLDEGLRAPMNVGREASAYLRFIVKYYDNLPKHMAFIHGHEHGWHQGYPGTLIEAITNAKRHEYDFVSLNVCRLDPDTLRAGNIHWDTLQAAWPVYFENIVGVKMPHIIKNMDCSAQFVVSREQILKYPKSVWELWLRLASDPGFIQAGNFYFVAWIFEYSWHVIFGEPPEYQTTKEEYLEARFTRCA
jgi:hypothetical protein